MAQFSYKARKRSGEVVSGILDVNDRSAALAQISGWLASFRILRQKPLEVLRHE